MSNTLPPINLDKITDLGLRSFIVILSNSYEKAMTTILELKKENQLLKDEIAILKGEQGKPDIKPKTKSIDYSSNKQLHKNKQRTKSTRKNKIKIDKIVVCPLDKNELPADAINKGYERTISQNIIFKSNNTEYLREKYYSPSLNKTFIAPLPNDYTGYIDKNLKTFCHIFHHDWDITRSKLISGLSSIGIHLSAGMLNNILFEPAKILISEKNMILQAGLLGLFAQIDATGSKFFGINYTTQIICSPFFTIFTTLAKKDRLHVLFALQGEPETGLQYRYNIETQKYLQHFKISRYDREFLKRQFTQGDTLSERDFHKIISNNCPTLFAKKNMYKRVCESFAFAYYFTQTEYPIIQNLVSDDAGEYKMLALSQMLCWVHDARYYNKLSPQIENHRIIVSNFKERYWKYYNQLLNYKQVPDEKTKLELEEKFDELFKPTTDYFALNKAIKRTRNDKKELLTVLKQPILPLHNNLAELKARVKVRKRDISLHTMSKIGTRVQDAMMSIIQTAKQLKVNVWDYINS